MFTKKPVGLPGRAIKNSFIERTNQGRIPIKKCTNCLLSCNPADTPYCISDALINSVKGEDGLVFSGERASEINEIITVKKTLC